MHAPCVQNGGEIQDSQEFPYYLYLQNCRLNADHTIARNSASVNRGGASGRTRWLSARSTLPPCPAGMVPLPLQGRFGRLRLPQRRLRRRACIRQTAITLSLYCITFRLRLAARRAALRAACGPNSPCKGEGTAPRNGVVRGLNVRISTVSRCRAPARSAPPAAPPGRGCAGTSPVQPRIKWIKWTKPPRGDRRAEKG